jgi:hypothetical protein
MENTREAIAKIEGELMTEIEAAALKRDMNKMVLALTESVKALTSVAKEVADAFDALDAARASAEPVKAPAKKVAAKKAPAKKAAVARAQKTVIAPK